MGLVKIKQRWNHLFGNALLFKDKIDNIQVTSIDRFSEIISVWITNEIFRLGFFCSSIQLTHARGYHIIEALATVICATGQPTRKTDVGQHCFIDVSLQHPPADRPFRWALLGHRFLNNIANRKNNPEPKNSGHLLNCYAIPERKTTLYGDSCCCTLRFISFVLFFLHLMLL